MYMRMSLQKWLVDLSTTYLDKTDMKRKDIIKGEKFTNLKAGICYRKAVEWRRMADSIGYRCE